MIETKTNNQTQYQQLPTGFAISYRQLPRFELSLPYHGGAQLRTLLLRRKTEKKEANSDVIIATSGSDLQRTVSLNHCVMLFTTHYT